MDNPKNQIADKLKDASNVLVTVSANPSVDQLSAAIGLTLLLTKLKKHATAVFSGQVPSTIEFLKPEETIEQNTNSLRDFIIALDKAKADKIRYKVEENMVKIFITPYRTSIGEPDLVFSQGDFNVDIVVGLGVHQKEDLDQAITAHGRILHDATVATINTQKGSELGSLNWTEPQASSLCEMVVTLTDLLKTNVMDGQIATALLTGIVAETARFSNEKTSSVTMNASAKLMAAGANQQLVATKLQESQPQPPAPPTTGQPPAGQPPATHEEGEDGSLRINHELPPQQPTPMPQMPSTPPPPEPPVPMPPQPLQFQPDDQNQLGATLPQLASPYMPDESDLQHPQRAFLGDPFGNNTPLLPPSANQSGGDMDTALMDNAMNEQSPPAGMLLASEEPSTSSLNLPPVSSPLASHNDGAAMPPPLPPTPPLPPVPAPLPPPPPPPMPVPLPPLPPEPEPEPVPTLPKSVIDVMDDRTLKDIEKAVDSPHKNRREPIDYHAEATNQITRAVANKTLQDIEERTHSPHLEYEAMQSEPGDGKSDTSEEKPAEPTSAEEESQEAQVTLPAHESAPPLAVSFPSPVDDKQPLEAKTAQQEESPAGDADTDMDAGNIRARIDAALAHSDQTPQAARSDLNAAGEVDVSHEEEPQEPSLKKIEINSETGQMRYPENLVPGEKPKDASAAPDSDPSAPPPVPPPMPFTMPGSSASDTPPTS